MRYRQGDGFDQARRSLHQIRRGRRRVYAYRMRLRRFRVKESPRIAQLAASFGVAAFEVHGFENGSP